MHLISKVYFKKENAPLNGFYRLQDFFCHATSETRFCKGTTSFVTFLERKEVQRCRPPGLGKETPTEDFLSLGLIKAPAFQPCAPTEE